MTKQRQYQLRLRAEGKCQRCRAQCKINEHTGKPHEHCDNCRAAYNAERLARYYSRKTKNR